jgi:hypothetical protein
MYQRLTGTGRFLFLHYNVKFRGSKTAGTGTKGYKTMPYRFQKPPIIVNGQKLFSHNADPQWMPCCDRCGELAATTAKLYTELAVDKWWKWFSYPKFSCQEEAFMGCERHPVEPEIHFLDGQVESFIRLPLTRWQRLMEPEGLILAGILALVFAVIVGLLLKYLLSI